MGPNSSLLMAAKTAEAGRALPGLLLTLACLTVLACGQGAPSQPSAPPLRTAPQSETASACADCHAELVASYARTGMARALGPLEVDELVGLGEVAAGDTGYRYGFVSSPDGRRAILGETHDEHPTHALGAQVLFGIGAGELDRSFAVLHGASMYFAPVEVLTEDVHGARTRRLALTPGEMMAPGGRLTFALTPECLACHTDSLPPPSYPLELLPDPATWEPRGISCGGCHGRPGELDAHVAWQQAELEGQQPAGADPLLDLAGLGRAERLSVCARCHLQGDARLVLEDGVLGPPPVGQDLLEQRALFVAAASEQGPGEVGFVSQVERLARSACFQASELDCATCHDPHASLHEPRPAERVRAACLTCHDAGAGEQRSPDCSRDPAGDDAFAHANRAATLAEAPLDCVSCHMPLTGVFDVAEVLIHDHWIRTDGRDAAPPSSPDALRFPESPTGDWERFTWDFQEPPDHVDEHGLWMMAYAAGGHSQRAAELVDRPLGPVADGLAMTHHVRAGLLEALGRTPEAEAAYRRALALDPDLAPSTTNLGLLLVQTGRAAEAAELLDELLARHPRAQGALRNRALARDALGDASGAAADLEAAFLLAPDADLAATLARIARSGGRLEQAERFARLAHELDPVRH